MHEPALSRIRDSPRLRLTVLAGIAVLAAAALLALAAPTASAHHYSPIQPGARLGGGCTMNFVYEDAGGTRYVGSAGHCYDQAGVRAHTTDGEAFGTVVYQVDQAPSGPVDFALIEIDASWQDRVDPSVRHWGGPIGTGAPEPGTTTLHYGHGTGPGDAEPTRARQGVVLDTTEETGVQARIFPFSGGDSGGPILDEQGRAIGVLGQVFGKFGIAPTAELRWEPTMPVLLDHMEDQGWDLSVATAPLSEDVVERQVTQVEHCLSSPTGPHGCVRGP